MGVKIDSLFRNDDSAKKIDRLLKRVEKPARYIGSEKNICKKKPQNKLRFAFAFQIYMKSACHIWDFRFCITF